MLKEIIFIARPFATIYLIVFLFSLHIALPLYINSSYLSVFISENLVGVLYTIAAFIILFSLTVLPNILSVLGNFRTIHLLLFVQMGMFLILGTTESAILIIFAFIVAQALVTLILFNIDVFLESYSTDATTGEIRGVFLVALNLAFLLGPLLAGIIVSDSDFGRVYLVSAALLLPIIYLVATRLSAFKDPEYDRHPFFQTVKKVWKSSDLRHVLISNLLMRFFFSWMVIYTPIYLNQHIGFSWGEVGVIIFVSLLPFVFLEIPVGRLADTKLGEREIMMVGFVVAALFTAALSFAESPSMLLWAALLFGTRIGISFIEITSESYFFKHIKESDTNILSIFRDTRPFSYIIGPIFASVLLFVMPLQYIFLVLAVIMLYGVWNSFKMHNIFPKEGGIKATRV